MNISFTLVILIFIGCTWQNKKSPILTLDKTSYDYGRIKQQDTLSNTIVVRNTGNDTLKIFKISATCHCLTPTIDKYEIAPLDSALLRVSIVSKNYTKGLYSEKIILESNSHELLTILNFKVNFTD